MGSTTKPTGGMPGDPETIRRLLRTPASKQILSSLQSWDPATLRDAADQALRGKDASLREILNRLSRDPDTIRAMEELDRTVTEQH